MAEGTRSGRDGGSDEATPLPPGPRGLPLIGNTLSVVRDVFGFYDRLAEHGDVVRYRVAGQRFTTLLHPDHIERVLLHEHGKFRKWRGQEFGIELAPDGLLFAEGERWRRQRTIMQDLFTPARIESYTDAMVSFAAAAADGWAEGDVVRADEAFAELTLHILARSLFDLDIAGRGDIVAEAAGAINRRADIQNLQVFVPQWVPTPLNRRFNRALGELDGLIDELIDERGGEAGDRADLLSLLLTATDDDGRSLSDEEIRDSLVTFLFAGHETTALALTYTFLLLASHPTERRAFHDEVDSVLGADPPTIADLPDLPYTEQVIRESLRLYPPAYVLFREAAEDVTFGGYRVPAGAKITLPQFRLHTDPRFWDAPDAFRPDRWAGDAKADRPEYAYFPFGGGPRHCIGMRFAMLELKLVLPTIAQRVTFDLAGDPDPALRGSVTLRPDGPIRLRVHRR